MRKFHHSPLGVIAAISAAILCLTTPQAVAVSGPGEPRVLASASESTKEIARENAAAVARGANVCGPNYNLASADPLPFGVAPAQRKGVLFNYTTADNKTACAIFDNNTGLKTYMELKSCPGTDTNSSKCSKDAGYFLEYAGPTYTSTSGPRGTCWVHKAWMALLIDDAITYGFVC
ncbi:hypothetical protein OG851_42060 (plasmid) [Streptomyces sp. NBC_00161]|uniref:hypothetical protein n=1 Tax=Streptomyces sp. NBC_00161 TaxID=2975671 RepID=UPI002F9070F9